MIKYKSILSFEAKEQILKGVHVCCIDRECCEILTLNHVIADKFLQITEYDNSDNRYEFYIAEESEDKQ